MADAILEQISENLIKGRAPQVKELVQQALDKKVPVADILNKGLVAGMGVIGERFKRNEVYVPEVLIAARAMSAGMSILKPKLVEAGVKAKGIVCVGTVKGDLHDIGKNLVCMMLEGAGYQVVDLGVNVDTEKFVKAAQENKAQVVGMSALLTTTMGAMKTTVDAFKEAGLYGKVKLMIGGAPVTQSFADEIGAHGYGPDAATAVDVANRLIGK
ncbi:MAG: Methionine synthase [Lentisphaerae bacterium ADurb.BinA184]|nr:MAG: Methionine synthase [Lentisphaerae bacterium ADurb.BinA184]